MDLQTLFYIVGIICMTLYTLLLIYVLLTLLYIKKRINDFHNRLESKYNGLKSIFTNPKSLTTIAAVFAAGKTLVGKTVKAIKNKKKS